jgi:hypothetical protein
MVSQSMYLSQELRRLSYYVCHGADGTSTNISATGQTVSQLLCLTGSTSQLLYLPRNRRYICYYTAPEQTVSKLLHLPRNNRYFSYCICHGTHGISTILSAPERTEFQLIYLPRHGRCLSYCICPGTDGISANVTAPERTVSQLLYPPRGGRYPKY